ncbi:MAG: MltA domain-containing protein [Burkholderiales bacterium]
MSVCSFVSSFSSLRSAVRLLVWAGSAAILGSLLSCAAPEPLPDRAPPVITVTPSPSVVAVVPPPVAAPAGPVRATARGRWVAADWSALPGWNEDAVLLAWPALLKSCDRPAPGWAGACSGARALGPAADERQVRGFLQQALQPWRVENLDGQSDGLITGYFEPLVEAVRAPGGKFTVPLYGPPPDLAQRKPWFTRAQIDSQPEAQAALKGREVAWVADPLDALLLQIQGSGRLAITEAGGQRRVVRVAYAGHNDQPYQSIGRWLVDQGAFTLEQANWPAIRNWARANPQRVREMLAANPRYVFFREEALPDPTVGPLGAQGVALTPGRSIAVDKDSIPYGTPVWVATTEPQPWAPIAPTPRPLQRLMLAQDTGSAITGAVRADYFWGWGDGAEDRAGRMKQPLRMWVLWPRS